MRSCHFLTDQALEILEGGVPNTIFFREWDGGNNFIHLLQHGFLRFPLDTVGKETLTFLNEADKSLFYEYYLDRAIREVAGPNDEEIKQEDNRRIREYVEEATKLDPKEKRKEISGS